MANCQTNHDRLCRLLRTVLVAGVQAWPGAASGNGSVQLRASAALYGLLLDHPIDRRGRCRSCRRAGAVLGPRWRRCRVFAKACLWLRRVDEALLPRLLLPEPAPSASPPAAPGRSPTRDPNTGVLSTIAADPPAQPWQTPAVAPAPPAPAGRPQPDHRGGPTPERNS